MLDALGYSSLSNGPADAWEQNSAVGKEEAWKPVDSSSYGRGASSFVNAPARSSSCPGSRCSTWTSNGLARVQLSALQLRFAALRCAIGSRF
jgi:hypothetical protein